VNQEQRTKVWVDDFQTKLTVRIILYLAAFLIVLANFLLVSKLLDEGPGSLIDQFVGMIRAYLPVWICLFLLVPVVAWDAIRFTHRLVGPLVRFRRTIHDITEGELVRPIKLRSGDFLCDLRDEFNQMLVSLERRGIAVLKPLDPDAEQTESQRTPA
jgi:hypothetical protein